MQFKILAAALLSLTSVAARADIGGYVRNCMNTEPGVFCDQRTTDFNQNGFYGRQAARMSNLPSRSNSSDNLFQLSFQIEINDYFNVFNGKDTLNATVKTYGYGFHRSENSFTATSPLLLIRDRNTHALHGIWTVDLKNNFGGEYVEKARTVEIDLPGQNPIYINIQD